MGDRILMKLDIQKNHMFQMLYFQFESDPETQRAGGGKQKSWKPEILENAQSGEIGMKLDGNNKHNEIDIIGTDTFSLGKVGVVNMEKLEKLR